MLHMAAGKPDLALADFNQSLEANPNHLHALYNRAALHCDQKRFDQAKEDYERILRLNPNEAEARELLAKIKSMS